MDCSKVGELILKLRKEKGMTQKDIASQMNISEQAVSKWERGLGCPDVTLLKEVSDILGVDIDQLLLGDLNPNEVDGGNMKRIKFYVCPTCGNIVTGTGEAQISCCGRKLEPLIVNKENEDHKLQIETIETDYFITLNHEMEKSHFISFIALVTCDTVLMVKLYPEQNPQVRIPQISKGTLYAYCCQHGLWKTGTI